MSENAITFTPPRLPWVPAIEEKYDIDQGTWRVLVETVWPAAKSTESVGLALAYCKARNLDPLKRTVHIVPVWDKTRGRMVETLWPGIAELRTTASRTGQYAGQDPPVYGPEITREWTDPQGHRTTLSFPQWCQVTVYRIVKGVRCAFSGPQTYWLEEYAEKKGGAPNAMWQKRKIGQITKCAEAAALRVAFPEELGEEPTNDNGPTIVQYGQNGERTELPTCRSQTLLGEVNRATEGELVDSVHEPGETGQATGLLGGADDQRADVADGGVDASGEERDVHLGDGQAEAEPPDAKRDGRGDATVDKSKEKDKPTAKKPPTSTPEQAAAFKDACLAASDKGVSYTKAKLGDLVVQVRDLGHVHEIPACTTWLAGYGHITEGVVTIKDDGAGQADGNEAVTDGKEPEPAQEFKWWCTTCEMGFNGTKCSNCHLDVDKIPYEDQWGR